MCRQERMKTIVSQEVRLEEIMESEPTPEKPSGGNFRRQEGGMWKPRTTPRGITDSILRSVDSGF